ncbi:MAG TPA: Fe-S protein assembly co-chaperone HscB [Polyangiaceae bacterium]|nr:Fe-S protein assembly co-chaperone HscB [Polyangiaceae bacterium]
MDPFATLGIARTFDVDLVAAERAHRDLSRALHPDRFLGAGSSERRAALGKAVEVNEAWRVVRDPMRRAEALLKLAGVPAAEGDAPKAAPEFLMDMIEQREALGDAKRARDLVAVRAMAAAMEARVRDGERSLSAGFASGEGVGALIGKLGELRFYRRFLDEVSAIEDELAAA